MEVSCMAAGGRVSWENDRLVNDITAVDANVHLPPPQDIYHPYLTLTVNRNP